MGAAKNELKGLASYCKAETTFTFHLYNLTLSNASLGINNREIKSESGVSFAIASQPFKNCRSGKIFAHVNIANQDHSF